MGTTRIFVTTDAKKASKTAGFWKKKKDINVVAIGPTTKIELTTTDSDAILWESDGDAPWFMVVATPDPQA